MAETIFLSFTMTGTPVTGAKKPAGKTVSGTCTGLLYRQMILSGGWREGYDDRSRDRN